MANGVLLRKMNILMRRFESVFVSMSIFLILIANVVARAIGKVFNFIDEIVMFLIIWTTFIGMVNATRKGQHIMIISQKLTI